MSEIEIHHGHGHDADPASRRVGILVGVVGILLSVATISSHREHTRAVIDRTEANDQWTYYQAKKTRQQSSEIALTMLDALAVDSDRPTDAARPAGAAPSAGAARTAAATGPADAARPATARAAAAKAKLSAARDKYDADAKEIQKEAQAKDADTNHAERRALLFDLGEGLLELGLVLCSLYFMARKNFFPVFGVIAATLGTVIAAAGYLI